MNQEDRLNPKCPLGPWSNMEEWGGKSWFPKEEEGKENESAERYGDTEPSRKS